MSDKNSTSVPLGSVRTVYFTVMSEVVWTQLGSDVPGYTGQRVEQRMEERMSREETNEVGPVSPEDCRGVQTTPTTSQVTELEDGVVCITRLGEGGRSETSGDWESHSDRTDEVTVDI